MISVLILVYNEEASLEACFQALKNQRSSIKKMVVVDDCSTDKSAKIITKYSEELDLKVHVNDKNMGTNYSISEGLKQLVGEFVHIRTPHDYFVSDIYETLTAELLRTGSEVLFTRPGLMVNDVLETKSPVLIGNVSFNPFSKAVINFLGGISFSSTCFVFLNSADVSTKFSRFVMCGPYCDFLLKTYLFHNKPSSYLHKCLGYYKIAGDTGKHVTSKRQVFRTFFVIRDLSKAKFAGGCLLRTIFVPISRDFLLILLSKWLVFSWLLLVFRLSLVAAKAILTKMARRLAIVYSK